MSHSTLQEDEDRLLEIERRSQAEEARALQQSSEDAKTEDAERSRPLTLAGLEAALDDALRHTADGRSFEENSNWKSAYSSYKQAVGSFVQAKKAVAGMPGDQRPEGAVLDLIASGTAQCKASAGSCRARGRAPALAAAPLLDASRRLPLEELEKVVLDADDV